MKHLKELDQQQKVAGLVLLKGGMMHRLYSCMALQRAIATAYSCFNVAVRDKRNFFIGEYIFQYF